MRGAGSRLDIVLETDLQNGRVVARKALVYDVMDRLYIISQTSPPLYGRHIGAKVNASYLIAVREKTDKKKVIRVGFPATLVELIKEYPLSSSSTVPAFVMKQEGEPAGINLRMHYRVKPTVNSEVTLLANGKKVNLINISIGGVQFSHRKMEPPLEYGKVALSLMFEGRTFNIDGQIVRISNPVETAGYVHNLENVSARFVLLDKEVEYFLGKKILLISAAANLGREDTNG
jgi:hypothetical protein